MRRLGEWNFRIKIFTNIRNGEKDELGTRCPELVLHACPKCTFASSLSNIPDLILEYKFLGF
jgi:hypothetical protein